MMKKYADERSTNDVASWQRRLVLLLLMLLMIPLFFVSRSVFTSLAQNKTGDKERIIKKMNFRDSFTKEPIQIVEVKSNGKTIRLDEAFVDEDWLTDFTVKFKNVSSKTISSFTLNLLFPETAMAGEPRGIPTSYDVNYGLSPSRNRPDAAGFKVLRPGESDEITLDSTSYARLKAFLAKRKDISDLTTANLTLVGVEFDDGMHWSAGDIFRPDPLAPGNFTVVRNN